MSEAAILLIEPSLHYSRYMGELLQVMGYRPSVLNNVQYLEDYVEMFQPDIVMVAQQVYRTCEQSISRALQHKKRDAAVILLGEGPECYPQNSNGLTCVSRKIMPLKLKQVLDDVLQARRASLNPEEPNILGPSHEMLKLRLMIQRLAASEVSVLIRGESGTGKELVARSIHYHSRRRNQPFIKINSAAIPESLEHNGPSGHGTHSSGATFEGKWGAFESAREGTLFLQQVEKLSLYYQAKLLQMLQEEEFFKLGGRQGLLVKGRILAATTAPLEEMVAAGLFRSDLYYRLNVAAVFIPPLRKRREDIVPLARHFMQEYCHKYGKEPLELQDATWDFFHNYAWPGNVRELKTVIHKIVVLGSEEEALASLKNQSGDQVKETALRAPPAVPASARPSARFDLKGVSLKEFTRRRVEEAESRALLEALKYTRWNRRKAAEVLEISYKSLLNKISRYRLGERTQR